MTETMYAGKMPILALRGLAVFPDQTVHFDVGRIKSGQALDAAMKSDQRSGSGCCYEVGSDPVSDSPEGHAGG